MKTTNKKLWSAQQQIPEIIERFTVGQDRELDLALAEFDVLGSIAHITMLQKVGLLTEDEFKSLKKELKNLYTIIKKGEFVIENGVEDVHSQVELFLTKKLGNIGQKIHTGRSRNDQILLDLRLFIRDQIKNLTQHTKQLFDVLMDLSEKYKDVLLPGYTHFQIAMPSSFGLWFTAYAESLVDDLWQLWAAFKVINKNPLGSAAGYGSSFPLDRHETTRLLGFDALNINSVYAQMGRGKSERVSAQALSSFAETLSRMAMDVVLYLSQNFAFISFPEFLTTGSSIMPHKHNPDIFELIRAKCNRLKALPNEFMLITANLPSGYHRDYQILKEHFLPAFPELLNCLELLRFALPHIQVQKSILEEEKYKYLFSVEAVNKLVQNGTPFRKAYHAIADEINSGEFTTPTGIKYTHTGSLGNLGNQEIKKSMDEILAQFRFDRMESSLRSLLK